MPPITRPTELRQLNRMLSQPRNTLTQLVSRQGLETGPRGFPGPTGATGPEGPEGGSGSSIESFFLGG